MLTTNEPLSFAYILKSGKEGGLFKGRSETVMKRILKNNLCMYTMKD